MLKQQGSFKVLPQSSPLNFAKKGMFPVLSNNGIKPGQPVTSPRTQCLHKPLGFHQANYRQNRTSIFGIKKQNGSEEKSFQESSRKSRPSVSPIRNPHIYNTYAPQNKHSMQQNRLIVQHGYAIPQVQSIFRYGSPSAHQETTPSRIGNKYIKSNVDNIIQMKQSNISDTNNSSIVGTTNSYHQPKTPSRYKQIEIQNNMHLNKENRVMYVNSPSPLGPPKNCDQKNNYRPISKQDPSNGFFFPGYQQQIVSHSPFLAKNTTNNQRNHQNVQCVRRQIRQQADHKTIHCITDKAEQQSSTMQISQIQINSPQKKANKSKNFQAEIQSPEKSCINCSNYAHYKSATTCKYYCAQCAIQQMVKGVKLIQKPKNKKQLENHRKQPCFKTNMGNRQSKKMLQRQKVEVQNGNQKQYKQNVQQTKILCEFKGQMIQQRIQGELRELLSCKMEQNIQNTQSVEIKVSQQDNNKSRQSKKSVQNMKQQSQTHIRSSALPFPSRQQQITTFLNNIDCQHKLISSFLQKSINPYQKKIQSVFKLRKEQLFAHYQQIQRVLKQSQLLDLQYLEKQQAHYVQIQKIERQRLQKDLWKLEGIKKDIQPNIQKIVQKVQDAKYKQFMLKYNAQYNKIHSFRNSAQKQGNYNEVEIEQQPRYRNKFYQPLIFRVYGGYFESPNIIKQQKTYQESRIQANQYQSNVKKSSKGRNQPCGIFFSFQKKRKSKGSMEK